MRTSRETTECVGRAHEMQEEWQARTENTRSTFSANASGAFEFLPSGVESPLAGPFYFPRKTQCWICGHFLGT